VSIGAFLAGNGIRTSVQAGMSLAQIGEFSFIIAGLGVALGSTRDFIYAIAVAVCALTTLTTPWLIRASEPVALWLDRKLPRSLQTFVTLYGSWVEALQTAPRRDTAGAAARRLVLFLALDAAILAGLGIGVTLGGGDIAAYLVQRLRLAPVAAHALTIAASLALAVPFVLGIFRITRRLGDTLAEVVLPRVTERKVDFADAPRRAFVVTLQLAVVLLVCLPLVAVLQPFLPRLHVVLGLALVLVALGLSFWRSAKNLQGHVKAGTEIIVEALAKQSRPGAAAPEGDALAALAQLLPGLGAPATLRIAAESTAVGKTLAQLNVRGLTGATVLAIRRGDVAMIPSAKEALRAGDVLAVAGTHAALDAARALLDGTAAPRDAEP
jgi:CPA2 family monovalent cation:H+ antiporter-2